MNLLFHQLKKDIRALRLPFAAWLALLIVRMSLEIASDIPLPHVGAPTKALAAVLTGVGLVVYWVFTVLLAAWIVLEDPPGGTTAFWLTRPLPPRRVAASKLLLLACLVLVPAGAEIGGLILAGATLPMLAVAAVGQVLYQAPVVLAAGAFALVGESLGGVALTALLTLLGAGIVTAIVRSAGWLATKTRFHPAVKMHSGQWPELLASRLYATSVLICIVAIALFVWRYLRKHAGFPHAVIAVCAFALMQVPIEWQWNFLDVRTAAVKPPDLFRSAEHGPIRFAGSIDEDMGNNRIGVECHFGAVALADGLAAVPERVDGYTVVQQVHSEISRFPNLDGTYFATFVCPDALARALGSPKILNAAAPIPYEAYLNGFRPPLGIFSSGIELPAIASLRRFIVSANLPLKVGAVAGQGMSRLKISSLDASGPGRFQIALSEIRLQSALASVFDLPDTSVASSAQAYVIVNGRRHEAVVLDRRRLTAAGSADLKIQTVFLGFSGDSPVGQAWLRGARLIMLRLAAVGQAPATVEINGPLS
ncbi:MAG: hypothetical protein ACREFX_12770 [Opitutaceae bacterium]